MKNNFDFLQRVDGSPFWNLHFVVEVCLFAYGISLGTAIAPPPLPHLLKANYQCVIIKQCTKQPKRVFFLKKK